MQQLEDKDKEIFSLRKQNEKITLDKNQVQYERDQLVAQMAALKQDVTTMVKENQVHALVEQVNRHIAVERRDIQSSFRA